MIFEDVEIKRQRPAPGDNQTVAASAAKSPLAKIGAGQRIILLILAAYTRLATQIRTAMSPVLDWLNRTAAKASITA